MAKIVTKDEFFGKFYPAQKDSLRAAMDHLLKDKNISHFPTPPKALIMPHSGWRYCGDIMADAAREISPNTTRIVIISVSHHHDFEGVASPSNPTWDTPIGTLGIQPRILTLANRLDFVKCDQEYFDQEQGIGSITPWVKKMAPNAEIAPFIVGRLELSAIEDLLRRVWGDDNTQIIISTDLSHFNSPAQQSAIDLDTAIHIESGDVSSIGRNDACGAMLLRALLNIATQQKMRVLRLGLSNSSQDETKDEPVVGYGAWVIHASDNWKFPLSDARKLYRIAAQSAADVLSPIHTSNAREISSSSILETAIPACVHIYKNEKRCGSYGLLKTNTALSKVVSELANKAAIVTQKNSFKAAQDFDNLHCQIELIGLSEKLTNVSKDDVLNAISQKKCGVKLDWSTSHTAMLPEFWERYKEPEAFLNQLFRSANLPVDFWDEKLEFNLFHTEKLPMTRLITVLEDG